MSSVRQRIASRWYQANKDYKRDQHLQATFGITLEQYNQKFADQEGRCAICTKHQSEFKKSLAIDHNHTTNQVRGLLCINCNTKLSVLENEDFKDKATTYLDSYKEIIHV